MPEQWSEDSPYSSLYGGGFISASQYLAESMVARRARSSNITLPQKFWNVERWKRVFLMEVRHASRLLTLYSVEAIIKALRTKEGKRVYSFGAKWLDPLIAEEQRLMDVAKAAQSLQPAVKETEPTVVVGTNGPRPAFSPTKSKLNKLRDLDGQEEGGGS
jgi:hypothetical protein